MKFLLHIFLKHLRYFFTEDHSLIVLSQHEHHEDFLAHYSYLFVV